MRPTIDDMLCQLYEDNCKSVETDLEALRVHASTALSPMFTRKSINRPSEYIITDDLEPDPIIDKLSLVEVEALALSYGYSLTKIEDKGADLSGTTKINLKGN